MKRAIIAVAAMLVFLPAIGSAQSQTADSPPSVVIELQGAQLDSLMAIRDLPYPWTREQHEELFRILEGASLVRDVKLSVGWGGEEIRNTLNTILATLREHTAILKALCERDSGDVDTQQCPKESPTKEVD